MRQVRTAPLNPGRDSRCPVADGVALCRGEHGLMADLAFAVLLITGFLVLALTLRGLEKL